MTTSGNWKTIFGKGIKLTVESSEYPKYKYVNEKRYMMAVSACMPCRSLPGVQMSALMVGNITTNEKHY